MLWPYHLAKLGLTRHYAQVLWKVGQRGEALELLENALEEVVARLGSDAPESRGLAMTFSAILRAAGDSTKNSFIRASFCLDTEAQQ